MASKLSITEQKSDKLSPIKIWLEYVSDNIARHDLPLLKLCLYPMFKSRMERDNATTASELFYSMVGATDKDLQQTLLYCFICALKVVGGKRRGMECVAELRRREIEVPVASDYVESLKFRFFQCFARVARDMEADDNSRNKMREVYGRRLRINHRKFEHIADMFTAIYEAELVTPDDCKDFCVQLERCEKGQTYISTMNKYTEFEGAV